MERAGTSRTGKVVRSATPKAPATRKASETPPAREPSWGRVLATTISLWTARRLPRRRRPGVTLVVAACVLIAAVAVVTAVQLTGTTAKTARTGSPGNPHPG